MRENIGEQAQKGGYEMLINGPRQEAYKAFNDAVLDGVLSSSEVEEIYRTVESVQIDIGAQTEQVAKAFSGSGFRMDGTENNPDGSCTYKLVSTFTDKPFLGEVIIRIDGKNKDKYKTPQIIKVEQMIEQAKAENADEKVVALEKINAVLAKLNEADLNSLVNSS